MRARRDKAKPKSPIIATELVAGRVADAVGFQWKANWRPPGQLGRLRSPGLSSGGDWVIDFYMLYVPGPTAAWVEGPAHGIELAGIQSENVHG